MCLHSAFQDKRKFNFDLCDLDFYVHLLLFDVWRVCARSALFFIPKRGNNIEREIIFMRDATKNIMADRHSHNLLDSIRIHYLNTL